MPNAPRIAVVIACSKAKDARPELIAARDRYRGRAFRLALAAIDSYRDIDHQADLFIVSGGLGVVNEWDTIPNYDVSIPAGRGVASWRTSTRMPAALLERLSGYDAALVALPRAYVDAMGVTQWRPARGFLITSGSHALNDGWQHVRAGRIEARARSVAPREVGALVFSDLLIRLKREGA
jgi:hypothetical protein